MATKAASDNISNTGNCHNHHGRLGCHTQTVVSFLFLVFLLSFQVLAPWAWTVVYAIHSTPGPSLVNGTWTFLREDVAGS